MIIPMLCVTIFVILVVWFLLPRVARLMIHTRSEERFSRNAETDIVCRLLLEKKNVSSSSGSTIRPRKHDSAFRRSAPWRRPDMDVRCQRRMPPPETHL